MSRRRLAHSFAVTVALATIATPAAAADQAERALHVRSVALNQRAVAADTTGQAERALHLRSQALNERSKTAAVPRSSAPRSRGGIGSIDAGALLLAVSVLSLTTWVVVRHKRADTARRRTAHAA